MHYLQKNVLRLDRTAGCVVSHSHYYHFGLVYKIAERADISRTGATSYMDRTGGAVGPGGPEKLVAAPRIGMGRCGPVDAGAARGPD